MNRFHRAALLSAFAVSAIALAGCGVEGNTVDDLRDDLERVQEAVDTQGISLPAIPIPVDIDDDGRVTEIGGIDTEVVDEVVEVLTGNILIGKIGLLNKDQVAWFKRSNIQHITLASRPEGLYILVNGDAMPFVAWDDGSVEDFIDVLEKFREDDSDGTYLMTDEVFKAVERALPLAQSLGVVRFDLRFPRDPKFDEIPLPNKDDFDLALTEIEIDRVPLQNVNLEVEYEPIEGTEDWVPAFYGFTTVDLQDVGEPLDLEVPQLRLRRDIRRRLQNEGIGSVGVEARADGLFFTVNGDVMPHLAWSEATLTNLSTVLSQLYPADVELPDDAQWVPLVRATAPMYNDFAIAVLFRFPEE